MQREGSDAAKRQESVIRSEVEQNDGPLPDYFITHIVRWLVSNEKHPSDVRHGRFPLGMVQRWIERAEEAEVERDRCRAALRDDEDALLRAAAEILEKDPDLLKRGNDANT